MQHGQGKMSFDNGCVYNGNWEDGVIEGYGQFAMPSGIKYKGNHTVGKRNGKGTLEFQNGDIFTGIFEYDQMHSGELRLADGSVYRGEF